MFKIDSITLISYEKEEFKYDFNYGLNYIKGNNSTGKTEFYTFIDYMFGSSCNISDRKWYKDSLKEARMKIIFDNISYILIRSINNNNFNKFYLEDDINCDVLTLTQYKNKINYVFSRGKGYLKELHSFVEEEITFRSFTLFNFLGESRQGELQNFFDKCKELKYSIKLNSILNFIFNDNLKTVRDLEIELEVKNKQLKELQKEHSTNSYKIDKVNENLRRLNIDLDFNGRNVDDILSAVNEFKNLKRAKNKKKDDNIELLVKFDVLKENLKRQDEIENQANHLIKQNENRLILLKNLEQLLQDIPEYKYLISPLIDLINETEQTITFSNYTIERNVKKLLMDKLKKVEMELNKSNSKLTFYSLDEKKQAITIINDCLNNYKFSEENEIGNLKDEIKKIKKRLIELKNTLDIDKINHLSKFITELYNSAKEVAPIVEIDNKVQDLKLIYVRQGNILQPIMDTNDEEYYYIGSKARRTLIQMCGYLGFLNLLINENSCPIIPMFVLDHISQSFDKTNKYAVGKIIETMYKKIKKENLQIFIFDDKNSVDLGIIPDKKINLETEYKTGFNPFYSEK